MSNTQELRSFPPIDDAIEYFENIDWENVRERTLRALALLGTVLSFLGGQLCAFGEFLQELTPKEQPKEQHSQMSTVYENLTPVNPVKAEEKQAKAKTKAIPEGFGFK